MLRVASLTAVTLAAMGAAQAARATAVPGTWLAWSSSSDVCGDAGAFAGRVEGALGRSPARAAADARVNVTARIAVATTDGVPHWVGEVRLRGEDQRELGSRTIDRGDVSCQPVVDALAVVTALALTDDGIVAPPPPSSPSSPSLPEPGQGLLANESPLPGPPGPPAARLPEAALAAAPTPTLGTRPPASARAPPPAEPFVSSPSPSPSPSPLPSLARSAAPPPASTPQRWRSGVQAGTKLGVGLLPDTAFGTEVSGYLRHADGWKLFLAFDGWQRQITRDELGRGASLARLTVGLGLCPLTVARGRWEGAACLGGDVGRLSATGVGFARSFTEDRLTLDAGLGVELTRYLVGPLAAGLTVGVIAPLIRNRISYSTADGVAVAIFREWPVAAMAGLHLSLVFGS